MNHVTFLYLARIEEVEDLRCSHNLNAVLSKCLKAEEDVLQRKDGVYGKYETIRRIGLWDFRSRSWLFARRRIGCPRIRALKALRAPLL